MDYTVGIGPHTGTMPRMFWSRTAAVSCCCAASYRFRYIDIYASIVGGTSHRTPLKQLSSRHKQTTQSPTNYANCNCV